MRKRRYVKHTIRGATMCIVHILCTKIQRLCNSLVDTHHLVCWMCVICNFTKQSFLILDMLKIGVIYYDKFIKSFKVLNVLEVETKSFARCFQSKFLESSILVVIIMICICIYKTPKVSSVLYLW